jgi:purine-binding chemotaxis protein CheW
MQAVTFYINDNMYGIDIRLIREVYPEPEISIVPLSEPFVSGLVNIRGQVVLVLDIAVLFGYPRTKVGNMSHIIIFKTEADLIHLKEFIGETDISKFGDKPVAFLVEKIGDVCTINENELEPFPKKETGKNFPYLNGMIKLGNRVLALLNPGKMFFPE